MKVGGVAVEGPHEALLVLPRGDKQLVFKAVAILDFAPFWDLCPEPVAPKITRKGATTDNVDDKGYIAAKAEHERRKMAWTVLTSLAPSNIEWETVDLEVPGTWCNYTKELLDNKFTTIEINLITELVLEANNLDEKKLQWARDVFLQGQRP